MAGKTIVLDIRIPFRTKKDREALPNEAKNVISSLDELKGHKEAKAEWARVLNDYGCDEFWLQAYRQDPRKPFEHANPHVHRRLKTGQPEDTGPPEEPEQRSGKSGLLVATVYFPNNGPARSEEELAKSTDDFLTRLENAPGLGQRLQAHCRRYGHRSINARGEEYDDLTAVKKVFAPPHHSISGSVSAECSVDIF
ncbi:MAG: hypothetical protein E3J21_24465 [Anaerolineales bacterium]|nr:MAG: hypothetical protein E3J21_24465 [Anaerolineales bacterium]